MKSHTKSDNREKELAQWLDIRDTKRHNPRQGTTPGISVIAPKQEVEKRKGAKKSHQTPPIAELNADLWTWMQA